MSIETAIWRMTEGEPVRLEFAALDTEKYLENTLVSRRSRNLALLASRNSRS